MAVTKKEELISYILKKYSQNLTPIKLQKALYFLFAYYGGMKRFLKENSQGDQVNDLGGIDDEYLFEASFEAWAYGPVDKQVYQQYKTEQIEYLNFEVDKFEAKLDQFTKGFLDDYIPQIMNTSDFGLVDLSHEDACWKKNFDRENLYHNCGIKSEDIILEYSIKQYAN